MKIFHILILPKYLRTVKKIRQSFALKNFRAEPEQAGKKEGGRGKEFLPACCPELWGLG
jgi:hypothetical protein